VTTRLFPDDMNSVVVELEDALAACRSIWAKFDVINSPILVARSAEKRFLSVCFPRTTAACEQGTLRLG
jgi:hypothetical protein